MKKTELRLFNIVNVFIDGSVKRAQVRTITDHLKAVVRIESGEWMEVKYKNIEGIPITEEILLKCGFIDESSQIPKYVLDKKKWKFRMFKNSLGYYTAFSAKAGFLKKIKYLHQLQNLYFCLTGEELNIEL